MKKTILQIAILFFTTTTAVAQSLPLPNISLAAGWQRANIKNVGNIDIPASMEIQSGKYKEYNNKLKSYFNIEEAQLVLQQKGINDYSQNSFKKYARVLLETNIGFANDFEKLNFEVNAFTYNEIAELSNYLEDSYTKDLNSINQKMITFYPVSLKKINNMSCMHIKYIRQMANNPQVLVNVYLFQNYDRVHKLTLSYRLNEAVYWEDDLKKVLSSFRITNIK